MLTTLYLKALDADFDAPGPRRPVRQGGDRPTRLRLARARITGRWAPLVTVRTAQYDIWARQFLAAHEHARWCISAAVWTAGCSGSTPVRTWSGTTSTIPAVIALREQIYPTPPEYHLIATSATDPSWLDQIPADRPVLLLAEGISMYLTEDEGIALLRRFVDRFPSGELQIDFFNWLGIRSQKTQTLVRRSGSTLHWAVNSPEDILEQSARHPIAVAVTFFDASTFRAGIDWRSGWRGALVRVVPPRAQGAAVPPLRVRARQLTPVAACCSAMAQSSDSYRLDGPFRRRRRASGIRSSAARRRSCWCTSRCRR